jgi:hypothetical protein
MWIISHLKLILSLLFFVDFVLFVVGKPKVSDLAGDFCLADSFTMGMR